MTRERLLKIHFPALLLTGIIILFLPFSGFWQDITGQSCPGPVQHSPDQNRRFFATISESYQAEKDFFAQVESGSLVVMGSSEMSNTGLPGIPFNFFTERGIPAIGFGHAGNQSLCMLTQLALMRSSLLQMRLVIIISPGWFEGKSAAGTPLQSFLEFNDEHFLYYLASDPLLPANVKTHLKSYVHAHLEKIDSPGALLKSMAYQHESDKSFLHAALFAPFVSLNETYAARKKRVMQDLFVAGCISKSYVRLTATTPQREPFPSLSVNWDSLEQVALTDFAKHSTNNSQAIENSYFDQWMRGKPLKKISPVAPADNQELQDLRVLLAFLKSQNCKPLIIMQALNPLSYDNLEELDPVLEMAEKEVKAFGFQYLNLHMSDKNDYQPGLLNDFQHLGPYGWLKINREIFNYFNTNE